MSADPLLVNTVILIEDAGSLLAHERAQRLSKKLTLPVYEINPQKKQHTFSGSQWQLVYTEHGLSLRLSSEPSWTDIRVDFVSSALQYRKLHGGGRNEAIAKAIGIKGKSTLNVLDCTAGMGTDSFVMASVGANVTMLERHPVIAALLEDALLRLEDAQEPLLQSLSLVSQDAIGYLESFDSASSKPAEVVYLDPMFPHKKKSALVKKEMQAFQRLLGPDQDSEALLSNALNYATSRVVVKRPVSAPELANSQDRKPTMAIRSKKHRFDVYIIQ
ncbi:class I SAM-dependent methyltransferase [Glaciecola sp. XM2]|jgi:16S rRNA (guanine1516-N2)-methyltransferase|uniref:class I SAM-dependent methyltransferase n=1 Tax=Glaciecola sp. XM2 TaxID=1914931 RepID=UPI001BDF698B|nr:class I SAM-dependent methyltransferase [Glaciecola sp. XM2]MBT1451801.1 class I SAM-dependent methyltransferase [Glaciecola sp. XM2]